jgi:hypothetical protein
MLKQIGKKCKKKRIIKKDAEEFALFGAERLGTSRINFFYFML